MLKQDGNDGNDYSEYDSPFDYDDGSLGYEENVNTLNGNDDPLNFEIDSGLELIHPLRLTLQLTAKTVDDIPRLNTEIYVGITSLQEAKLNNLILNPNEVIHKEYLFPYPFDITSQIWSGLEYALYTCLPTEIADELSEDNINNLYSVVMHVVDAMTNESARHSKEDIVGNIVFKL